MSDCVTMPETIKKALMGQRRAGAIWEYWWLEDKVFLLTGDKASISSIYLVLNILNVSLF
ncbi:hypothetical protein [Anaplasma phagocytophilum]|uniref:hypothetical protein n=1 Tax=Anaplasma phagocytophilum TaxID=948 RepID=UPI00201AE7B2